MCCGVFEREGEIQMSPAFGGTDEVCNLHYKHQKLRLNGKALRPLRKASLVPTLIFQTRDRETLSYWYRLSLFLNGPNDKTFLDICLVHLRLKNTERFALVLSDMQWSG